MQMACRLSRFKRLPNHHPEMLMSRYPDGRFISFLAICIRLFWEMVKTMGSAKQGYPVVSRILSKRLPTTVSAKSGAATQSAVTGNCPCRQPVNPEYCGSGAKSPTGCILVQARSVLPPAEL